jgi:hypothetical protein
LPATARSISRPARRDPGGPLVYDLPYDFENTGGTKMACSSAKCEEYLAIDLAHLRRQGLLRSGLPALLSWSRGNEPAGYIIVLPLRDGLR